MSQLALGDLAVVRPVGDGLDRCYTPLPLAQAIVDSLEIRPTDLIVEPSVGGGSFVRALIKRLGRCSIVGVDLDSAAEGLRLVDPRLVGSWPDVAEDWRRRIPYGDHPGEPDVIVGNPPFSGDTAIPHVEAALDLKPRIVALILPWAFPAVDRWAHLMDGDRRPALVRPIRPRPWGDKLRESALYVWTPREVVAETVMRPLVWR